MGVSESRCAGEILWKSSKNGDVKGLMSILDHAESHQIIDWRHPALGTTPLMVASQNGRSHVVDILIGSGARINATDSTIHRNTALHYAAYKNDSNCIRLLLDKGADPFIWNVNGHSAIDLARFRENSDSERILSHFMTLFSAWIYLKESGKLVPQWRRRHMRLLRCAPDNSSFELALYRNPHDIRPVRVFFYHPERDVVLPVEGEAKWSDKSFMFCFNQAKLLHKMYPQKFSRDANIQNGLEKREKCPANIKFAADSQHTLSKWLTILNEPPPVVMADYKSVSEELFPSSDQVAFSEDLFPTEAVVPPPDYSTAIRGAESLGSSSSFEASAPPLEDVREEQVCVICMDAHRDAVCVPCGHVASCFACLSNMQANSVGCPICRSSIGSVVRIYNA